MRRSGTHEEQISACDCLTVKAGSAAENELQKEIFPQHRSDRNAALGDAVADIPDEKSRVGLVRADIGKEPPTFIQHEIISSLRAVGLGG